MRGKKQCIFYLEMCGPDFSALQPDSIFALFSLKQCRKTRALGVGMLLQEDWARSHQPCDVFKGTMNSAHRDTLSGPNYLFYGLLIRIYFVF